MTNSCGVELAIPVRERVGAWWRWEAAVYVGILLLAAAVRFAGIGAMEISPDEGHSVYVATSARGVFEVLGNDTNQPLYFVLLKGWIGVFGESLAAVRGMSALFGVLMVGVMGVLVRRCGGSRRVRMWAMMLAGFAPLQIYYAQEAQGYTLATLLVALGMLTFVWAVRTGRWMAWVGHGVVVAVGAYAHNLFIPLAAGYWIALLLMRGGRKDFTGLAVSHAIAAVVAMPAVMLAAGQAKGSGGMAWIAALWSGWSPYVAIPRSLGAVGLGAWIPSYLMMLALPGWVEWLAVLLMVLGVVVCVWPLGETETGSKEGVRRFGWLLWTFTLWPLLIMWAYSMVRTIRSLGKGGFGIEWVIR